MSNFRTCDFCCNARVCHCLSDDNDFSSCSLGGCDKIRLMINSGYGKPVNLSVEKLVDNFGWSVCFRFYPKYCPNCGRLLTEDYKK